MDIALRKGYLDTLLVKLGIDGAIEVTDDGGTPLLSVGPELTLLGYTVNQPEAMAIEQICDLSIAFAFNMMRELCGTNWQPSQVLLSRRRPADTKPYLAFFKSMPLFDAELSGIAFPSHWLKHAAPSADELLFRQFQLKMADMRSLQPFELVDLLSFNPSWRKVLVKAEPLV